MGFLTVIIIAVLGVILIGSILGLTSSGAIARLQRENQNLNVRLEKLEAALEKGRADVLSSSSVGALEPEVSLKPAAKDDVPIFEPAPEPALEPSPEPVSEPELFSTPPQALQPAAATASAPATLSVDRPKPQKPSRNLEEIIGGQWSVWVGGFALLVGAVLLIRFSIDAGFFGPGARIIMALVLGATLLLAGEWLKRSDNKALTGKLGEAAKALQGNASVPGLLSAVGIFTLLGASYAAHALYGLIPAFAAFMALALISLGAMALSLRQGPILAGIGLLASLATPLLIQTDTPSLLMLIVYLVLVGGAALALSRRTGWGWLATGTVFGWLGWSYMSNDATTGGQFILWSAFLALGFVVTVWFAQQHKEPEFEASKEEPSEAKTLLKSCKLQASWAIVWGALAASLVAFLLADIEYTKDSLSISGFILGLGSVGALTGASCLYKKQSVHLVTAGLLGLVILMMANGQMQTIIMMLSLASLVVLAFLKIEPNSEKGKIDIQLAWNVFAVALGLMSVAGLDLFNRAESLNFIHAAVGLGFTGLFAGVGVWFKTRGADLKMIAIPVIGAGLGWALSGIIGLDNLSLSLFLSLGAALAGLTIWRVHMPAARIVILGLTGLTFAHAIFVQFPESHSLSTTPIINALWIYLALPAAILAGASYVLRGKAETTDFPKLLNGIIEAAALGGFALFAVFQIRHMSNGGQVYADSLGHAELGLQASIGLCFTLAGLSKRFAGNLVLSKVAEIISYVTLGIFALGSLIIFSPFFQRSESITGNVFFNSLTTGLLVPTVLLGLCAVMGRGRRSETYINSLGGLALAGALSWVTALIRFMYNGPKINLWSVDFGSLELWTISTVWLAFGLTLLALGVLRREQALRIASGVVIILTVLKAFIIDMAGLEGVLRALSFVALGLILIVIGRAYQRFWLSAEADEKAA